MVDVPCRCNKNNIPDYQDQNSIALGSRTDDIYRTYNLPSRFMYPRIFKGYGEENPPSNPLYRSTSSDYGWFAPTIHTVPTFFYPRTNSFSSYLAHAGMYRNYSLNTELDKTLF